MTSLQHREKLMVRLGHYLSDNPEDWQQAKIQASRANPWFIIEFIDRAVAQVCRYFLDENQLQNWLAAYPALGQKNNTGLKTGLVMAGNIPLVGFHDFLCCYLSGFDLHIKLSSKDTILWQHLYTLLCSWDDQFSQQVHLSELLKGCDAYIATGSNNTARYFEQYFAKYPHIIRRNRTSVAVLDGTETTGELAELSDDICSYFGLGCRNVSQIRVPEGYDFKPLLQALKKYEGLLDVHKYKNNYDFQLAIMLLNKVEYMSNGHLLLARAESPFAAISVLHYDFYTNQEDLVTALEQDDQLQCIVGHGHVPFGHSQHPSLFDYADGIDTLQFLSALKK